jgi:hypothetical protein
VTSTKKLCAADEIRKEINRKSSADTALPCGGDRFRRRHIEFIESFLVRRSAAFPIKQKRGRLVSKDRAEGRWLSSPAPIHFHRRSNYLSGIFIQNFVTPGPDTTSNSLGESSSMSLAERLPKRVRGCQQKKATIAAFLSDIRCRQDQPK